MNQIDPEKLGQANLDAIEMSDEMLEELAELTEDGQTIAILVAMKYMPQAQPDGEGASEEEIQKGAQAVCLIAALEKLRRDGLLETDGDLSFDPACETKCMQTALGRQVAQKLLSDDTP